MNENYTPESQLEPTQSQPEEQQEAKDNSEMNEKIKDHVRNFLNAVSSYQTPENEQGTGSYTMVFNQGDYAAQSASALYNTFNVPGVSLRALNRRQHEVTWNPDRLQAFLNS